MFIMKLYFLICAFVYTNILAGQEITLTEKPFTDNYYGKVISDPYRYMENTNDTLVQKWFKQNSIESRKLLDNISGRKEILEKLLELEKRNSFDITLLNIAANNYSFYLKKLNSDKTGKLYYKSGEKAKEILLFDPADYKKESGSNYSITYLKPSWNNNTVAIGLSKKGEEIGEIAFLNVTTKTLHPEIITHCWPAALAGIKWLLDDSGIIYIHIPVIDTKDKNYILNTESVIYKLGDNPDKHKIIFSKSNNPEIEITDADFPVVYDFNSNDKYITSSLSGATTYEDYYYANIEELSNQKINWKPLYKKEDGLLNPKLINDNLYCVSSKRTPNFKIIKTNITNPDFENPEVVVAENKIESIDDYVINNEGLFYSTTKNGVEAKLYQKKDNVIKQIQLPIKAGAISIQNKNSANPGLWVSISGWLNSKSRYSYDAAKESFTEANVTTPILYPEFEDFVVDEIEIPSHDGAMVPVSLIYKKGLKKDKMNNILIDGYGSFGISMKPRFRTFYLSWVLNGGVFAEAHVRGGSEKGDDWYKNGYKSTKPNSWKDLIATAEYLIKEKITSKERIAITSGSAGGILVGRAITERPDLFRVMICKNGELNTVRLKETPNGPNCMKEFGNPEIKEELEALIEMDSYLHIKNGVKYPSCLITTGMNDARVAPWISGKFAARLKASTASKNPIIFSVNYNTGHGLDNSNLELYNDFADQFAFAFWQLGNPKFKLINSD